MNSITEVAELHGHSNQVWNLHWCPTRNVLLSCSSDKSIRFWSIQNNAWCQLKSIDMAHKRTIRNVKWNPSGLSFASCSFDATTSIWERVDNESENALEYECAATLEGHDNEVKSIAWSSSGSLLATCSRDKSVWIWDAMDDGDFECIAVLQEHTQDVKSVCWHPTEEILASCSYDDTIRLWKDEDDDWFSFQTLGGHDSTVWGIDFNQNGNMLVSVSDDLSLKIWSKLPNGNYECTFTFEKLHSRTIYSVSWSKSNGLIATCGGDNQICILQVNEPGTSVKKVASIFNAHGPNDINCINWCELEGYQDHFATGGDDHHVRIWKYSS
ncbi:WD40-repeat-containing domain protein [Globomyces pollinis-pini]|nr:WD40-repeat-containing domain protein [Globomyces pollinis-pini]